MYSFLENILENLLYLNCIGIFLLISIPSSNKRLLKKIGLLTSSLTFIYSLLLWLFFNKSISSFQFVTKISWLYFYNINLDLGIDGISLFFIILTNLLIFICILASWSNINFDIKYYLIFFLFMELLLIGVFSVLDLLIFYIFFECVLIPMFFLIGIWGSRQRKMRASYFFFFFTLIGSVVMLLAIIYIYYQTGTSNYEVLLLMNFTKIEQQFLWFAFFLSFAAKVPMLPLHVWLPEAHVEASTTGSVILAGILLKLGTYGLIRYSFPLFPYASFYFAPFVYSLSVLGVLYASLTAIRQSDFKRIIAYTSIAHMNLVIVGIFSFHTISIEGAILQSISHGFVSSALFLIIGVLYDRHHTRLVKYYGGLAYTMPIYTCIFLFFTLANIGFPGTSSFVGEFLILLGSFSINSTITFFSAISMVLGGCYSLWLFNRIAYGNIKYLWNTLFFDLTKREFFYFLPLIFCVVALGLYPEIFLDYTRLSVQLLLELCKK